MKKLDTVTDCHLND